MAIEWLQIVFNLKKFPLHRNIGKIFATYVIRIEVIRKAIFLLSSLADFRGYNIRMGGFAQFLKCLDYLTNFPQMIWEYRIRE